jgi:acetoin utilization deacetylase AcuC-like enzyme
VRLDPRHLLFRLRCRLRRRRLPVWYSPSYRLPLTGIETVRGLEPRRADFVAWWLRESGAVPDEAFRTPRPISWDDLDRVHTLELLESIGRPATLAAIFGVDPSDVPADELLATVRLACGGTLAAAHAALDEGGPALNLLGGFHHAGPGSAGGNCPVNDVAVALATLRAEGFAEQAVVLDLDAHPPDGLVACLAGDPLARVGSLSGSDWGPLPGADETVLEGAGDAAYLAALDALLRRMPRPSLAFVIAGGDVLAGDRYGRLALTLAGARERELRVAEWLEGVPSVWLPGGGYHRDAWRVLAGAGMALATGSDAAIPARYDPLRARFRDISLELGPADLADPGFSASDLEEALGLATEPRRRRLLLGYYTAAGLEHGLYRYGVLSFVERIGYGPLRVIVDRVDVGDRARLLGEAHGEEHLLIEVVLQKRRVAGSEVLFVHWLQLRNPLARFTETRPPLPGQDVPGLGLARELGELFALMARRLALAGVAFRPAHFHTAFAARHNLSFVDPGRQGRFEALVRDIGALPLLEATLALDQGRVRMNGEPYVWEADDMVLWLERLRRPAADAVAAERERVRFEVSPPAPAAGAARG